MWVDNSHWRHVIHGEGNAQYLYHPRDRGQGRRGKENQPAPVNWRQKNSARVETQRYQGASRGGQSRTASKQTVPTRHDDAQDTGPSIAPRGISTGRIEAAEEMSRQRSVFGELNATTPQVEQRVEKTSCYCNELDQGLAKVEETHDVVESKKVPAEITPPVEVKSHLEEFFTDKRSLPRGADAKIDSVLGELVDSILRVSHKESQKHLPVLPRLCAKLRTAERESILHWLIQACDIMGFHEGVLYSTVLTLDRYCALTCDQLRLQDVQTVLMAVICTVIKACAVQDEILESMSLRDLLVHLCRQQVAYQSILITEHKVLRTLRFQISAPTPLDFLDALSAPLTARAPQELAPRRVADFIIRLSLFDANLHYRRPHAILAAGSLCVATTALNADVNTAAEVMAPIIQDVVKMCSDVPDALTSVQSCATELHAVWKEFAASCTAPSSGLLRMFGDSEVHRYALLHPPAASAIEAMQILMQERVLS